MTKNIKDLTNRYQMLNKIYRNEPILNPIIPGSNIYRKNNNKFVTKKMLEEQFNSMKLIKMPKTDKNIPLLTKNISQIVKSKAYKLLQKKYNQVKQKFQIRKNKIQKEVKNLNKEINKQIQASNNLCNKLMIHDKKVDQLRQIYYEMKRNNYELKCQLDEMNGVVYVHSQDSLSIINVDQMGYQDILRMQQRIGSVNVGLPTTQIAKIPTAKLIDIQDQNILSQLICSICCQDIQKSQQVIKLSCSHVHHVNCISQWLKIKRFCPLCKTQVTYTKQK